MKKQYQIVLVIIVAAVIVAGTAYQRQRQKAQDIVDESTVRTLVTQFGASMQKVSLSAPDAPAQIANIYVPYASSSLIKYWQANRSFAPGKGLSSPWPSDINIKSVTKASDGSYVVDGMVNEVTSQEVTHGGIAAEFPLTLTLKKYAGQWQIVNYQPGVATSFAPKTPTTTKP
jgi:hypothetical protein